MCVFVSELLLKRGASEIAAPDDAFSWTGINGLASPLVWWAIVLIIASFISWLYVLRYVPLSFAYPLSRVVDILVPLGCWIFLGELISTLRWCAGHLCGSAAHPQESDGILGNARYAQLLFRVARRYRRCSNDDFLFPDPRTATALRSELSLSFPRLERDLYHDSRRGGVERKTKRAARHRRAPDHRGNRARFDELREL